MEVFDLKNLLSLSGVRAEEYPQEFRVKCLNPAHNDKNPSMGISKQQPHLFHCFSCGYSGNMHSLVRLLTGKSFREYVGVKDFVSYEFKASLAKDRSEFKSPVSKFKDIKIKGKLYSCLKDTAIMSILKTRNIREDFIDYFNLKYCINAEINGTGYYQRICIPIYFDNMLVNMEGRTYAGSKVKVLYAKNTSTSLLFNYDKLDRNEELFVVEGIMDLPQLFNLGHRNITCTFGSMLTKNQLAQLNEFKNITLIPDNDEAGRAMIHQLDEYLEDKEFHIVELPEGVKDPGVIKRRALKHCLQNKVASVKYMLRDYEFFKEQEVSWQKGKS